jgi:hypothetical protein
VSQAQKKAYLAIYSFTVWFAKMHLRSNVAYTMVQDVLETQLRSHVVQAHKMADYRFQCEYCPKRLDTKQHMRNHVRFVKNNFVLLS